MSNVIDVAIRNKIATASDERYICGNSDYLIRFDFDAEWDPLITKTARFINGEEEYDVVFSGSECPVPTFANATRLMVGVYAGNLHTTAPAYIHTRKSILCDSGAPIDPPDNVYNQLMEEINEIHADIPDAVETALGNAKASGAFDGLSTYELAVKHGYDGTEAEWIAEQEASRKAAEEAAVDAARSEEAASTSATEAGSHAADAATSAKAAADTLTVATETIEAQEAESVKAVQDTENRAVEAVEAQKAESVKAVQAAAAQSAQEAAESASAAAESEEAAVAAAEFAVKTMESKGWLYVEGREDGNLYLVKADATDGISMKDDGHGRLVVVYGT